MTWQQPEPIIIGNNKITRVRSVQVTKQINGEAVISWVSDHDNQLHCGYLTVNGTMVYLGTPFPNGGKEADGGAWCGTGKVFAVGASQVGGAGIENELQWTWRTAKWARP